MNEYELYISILCSLLTNLKEVFEFNINQIYYDNIELVLKISNVPGIEVGDFTIEFQKQNGSFTLIINKKRGEELEKRLIELIESTKDSELFASYNFSDMKDISIKQFCYDKQKIEFNRNILNQFEQNNQIENLIYHNDLSKEKNMTNK